MTEVARLGVAVDAWGSGYLWVLGRLGRVWGGGGED